MEICCKYINISKMNMKSSGLTIFFYFVCILSVFSEEIDDIQLEVVSENDSSFVLIDDLPQVLRKQSQSQKSSMSVSITKLKSHLKIRRASGRVRVCQCV